MLAMNDYASTILYVMREEALAYVCFCSVMKRIRANFATNGVAIATKFHHLKVLLQSIDPVYWSFLESHDAGRISLETFIADSSAHFNLFSESLFYISMVTT